MSGRDEDNDSDAPEEFTAEQAIQQDEEITKVQRESKARVVREVKERRRKWAEKFTPRSRPKQGDGSIQDTQETEKQEFQVNSGMLPDNIVKLLTAREKKVFSSDSEEEKTIKKRSSKKSRTGREPVILSEIPPPQCLQNAVEFLKKSKMEVSRSSAVLINSNQALRLISGSGLLSNK